MKRDPSKLIFHTMHKRPMPGCLPLFFLLAAGVAALVITLVKVSLPEAVRPRGVGSVHYRNDELTRFQVRQRSALPLRLPAYADPAAQSPIPAQELPQSRKVTLRPAPPQLISSELPDSAALDEETLLRLPPAALTDTEVQP